MWPKQSECNEFYGNPRDREGGLDMQWYRENLVSVPVPWQMHMGGTPVAKIIIHRKCSASLFRVLQNVWQAAGKKQAVAHEWGIDVYSGSFNFRAMRGIAHLSMHAYGCAIDFDAPDNPLGAHHARFTDDSEIVKQFKKEGWIWGGDWHGRPDHMHFQAAIVD